MRPPEVTATDVASESAGEEKSMTPQAAKSASGLGEATAAEAWS